MSASSRPDLDEINARWRRRRRKERADRRAPIIAAVPLTELWDLHLPERVIGDTAAPKDPYHFSLARPGVLYYMPDGTPAGYGIEAALKAEESGQRWALAVTRRFRDGRRITISTVALPIDHGFDEGDPVLWETMVFQEHARQHEAHTRSYGAGQEQYRYRSIWAALNGHRTIVQAITDRNRARRVLRRANLRTAPIRETPLLPWRDGETD